MAGLRAPPVLAAALTAVLALTAVAADDSAATLRRRMVQEIVEMSRHTASATGRKQLDARVLAAMGRVPRHRFVPADDQDQAYANRPLPIGHGQTISQPYIVALMSDLLNLRSGDRVLEIGTGSGYQAAVLAEMGAQVYSIEIIEPLAGKARLALAGAGYGQVQLKVGDGYYGWPEVAPFDAIIVTAAASHVPKPLLKQLKPGGHLVIPVGTAFLTQELLLVQKQADSSVLTRQILPVSFVPLTGGPAGGGRE